VDDKDIWSKDGTAYLKDGYIYSHKEAARRGYETQEETESHDED